MKVTSGRISPAHQAYEVVERKGLGHPDTLADHLAEHLSRVYSDYTRERFGAILRHQFDKTTLMCGRCKVAFGDGQLLEPIRVLLNGRASSRLGDLQIPVRELLTEATLEFLGERLPALDPRTDVRVLYEVRHGSHTTTGGIFGDAAANDAPIHYRFDPRTLDDLPETHCVSANDTSLGCAFAPYTPLERLVLGIEADLNGSARKAEWPWLGSDIKLMAMRWHTSVSLVVAAPVLARQTPTEADYFDRIAMLAERIRALAGELAASYSLEELVVNSGDNLPARKLYMNLTGSSIESGDEGQVGRGNRMGGVIAPARPFTMEGICGKNPVYHVGKVYSAAAFRIAQRLHDEAGLAAHVSLLNRMGEPLATPWSAYVAVEGPDPDRDKIERVVRDVLEDLGEITQSLLRGEFPLA
jgi:S-adenosylmethionine synthetase